MHPSLEIEGSASKRLRGKRVVLALTGSVALVKGFEICRELMRRGAQVQVVMSEAAQKLVSAEMMHYASGRKPITEITGRVEHVEWFGKKGKGDLLLIAPATANTISKIALGIDDTPVTTFATTAIGSGKPVILVPAMHESMYNHAVVKKNLKTLARRGVLVMEPLVQEGKAKLAGVGDIVLEGERALLRCGTCRGRRGKRAGSRVKGTLEGAKVVVSAGTTYESIDPVRVIATRASGKTGLEIAREAYRRGAEVTLLHNHNSAEAGIKQVTFSSAREMKNALMKELKGADYFVSSAAVGDFTIAGKGSKEKIKSGSALTLALKPNEKIISGVRKKFPKLFIAGFKAETNKTKNQMLAICSGFMRTNGLQMVVGNDIARGGMGTETNSVVIVRQNAKPVRVSGKKEKIAEKIVLQMAR
ncbi:MAG: bifunctional phosphopantothenoylcysteine decarboxylase/phosphopantothenate--cysteine ligase CoaBC [Candidatus Diapherotrites archaeon]